MKRRPPAHLVLAAILMALAAPLGAESGFVRGDANGDQALSVADAIAILSHAFIGTAIRCRESADVDGDGRLSIADPLSVLIHTYLGGPPPAPPFPGCGAPPRGWVLGCAEPTCEYGSGGGESLWMARADGCRQCETCTAPSLKEVVAALEAEGIAVSASRLAAVPVCAACSCSSGRFYAVLVGAEDKDRLVELGWETADFLPPE